MSQQETKRPRGRPKGVDTSARLTIQMRPETKAKLEALAIMQQRPVWLIVDEAILRYRNSLATTTNQPLPSYSTVLNSKGPSATPPDRAQRTPRTPAKEWLSLAAFVGTGEYGGSSMSRLSTKEITAAAKKRGIDPALYLDGTRAGRNRLELAIQHRSEVLEAIERGENVPIVALMTYPDLLKQSQI